MELKAPRRTIFGKGSAQTLGVIAAGIRSRLAFLVTDKGVEKAGLIDHVVRSLRESDIQVVVFDGVEPEPTLSNIEGAVAEFRRSGAVDLIVSVGGGSVMDVAKCVNVVGSNGGSILDYEDGMEGSKPVSRLLPHIAVPTTAGTGSEATVWAVFIDPSRRFKTAVQAPELLPNIAILDPEMTVTMPPKVTAATGMDALTHAIEGYVSAYANPITEALCEKAIELVAANLRMAFENGSDMDARMNMLTASYMAGLAFSNSSLGIVHTLAEAMGGWYRIPHGVTNSLMLPHVMRFNIDASPEKFARIAELMGAQTIGLDPVIAAGLSSRAVESLSRALALPQRLREVGVRKEDFEGLVALADKWANLSGNPKQVSREQIARLYLEAY